MAKAGKENSLTDFNPENDAKAEEVSEEKASEEIVTEAADGNNAENQSDAMEAEAESILSAFVDACCYGGPDTKDADSSNDDNSLKEEKDR